MSTNSERATDDVRGSDWQEMRREVDEIRENTRRTATDQWFQIAGRVLVVLAPIAFGFLLQLVRAQIEQNQDTRQRVRILEETRFTARDGAAMRAELLEQFTARFPPPWMTDSIRRIEAATSRVAERLTVLEQRLSAMEGKLEARKDGR